METAFPMTVQVYLKENRNESPEFAVSWFSRATYHYLHNLLKLGYKKALEVDDLYLLDPENSTQSIENQFQDAWKRQQSQKGPIAKVFWTFLDAFGRDFYLGGFLLLLYNTLNAVTPVILQLLLKWLESPDDRIWIPYTLSMVLFLLQLMAAFSYNWQYELAAKSGFRLRTGLSAALYAKFFRLSTASKQAFSVGKIVNISTTDTARLDMTMQFVHMAWTSPILILIVFVVLYLYMGISGMVALL
jgi:hypothetical protein